MDKDALNENFEYCNDLAERINMVSEAILKISEKINTLGNATLNINERLKAIEDLITKRAEK